MTRMYFIIFTALVCAILLGSLSLVYLKVEPTDHAVKGTPVTAGCSMCQTFYTYPCPNSEKSLDWANPTISAAYLENMCRAMDGAK